MRSRSILITAVAAVVVLVVGVVVVRAVVANGPDAMSPAPSISVTPRATDSPVPTATSHGEEGSNAADLSAFTDYVALGDSYAAGVGAGPPLDPCQRSGAGYPDLLEADGATLTAYLACGGATTEDVRSLQLGELSDQTDLVTLTIGGNDLGAIELATDCADSAGADCQKQFVASLQLLKKMPTRLLATYADVATAAPNARILVTGYPTLFRLPEATDPDFSTIAIINAATASLNNMIEKAVSRVRAAGATIEYVPVDFAGHGIGSRNPWINAAGSVGAFHPTQDGYVAYQKALEAALSQ